jgi:large subunit ribosomal protein L4
MELDVLKVDGTPSGEKISLADEVFSVTPNDHAIYLSVKMFLANQRQGTSKAKERSEVKGGGKKPWKQKGRGGARAGTTRSPLWVGGGTIFGPRPRDYRQSLPRKVQNLAKVSALSYKVKDEQILVVEELNLETPSTKSFAAMLSDLKINNKKVLYLTGSHNETVYKAGRNIHKVKVLDVANASPYDILNNQILILQKSAAEYLNTIYSKKVKAEAVNA